MAPASGRARLGEGGLTARDVEVENFAGSDAIAQPARSPSSFRPIYVLAILAAVPLIASAYYAAGRWMGTLRIGFADCIMFSTVLAASVTGGYQIYLWTQRNNTGFPLRTMDTSLDDRIPFSPRWVWVYLFLYYPLLGYVVATIPNMAEGIRLLFGGLMLLGVQSGIAMLLPCAVPCSWRIYRVNSLSTRLLRFSQRIDNGRNCWPSMHCALAMYVCCLLAPSHGPWVYALVFLVAASCLLVKQHQVLDVPPGLALGWATSWAVAQLV